MEKKFTKKFEDYELEIKAILWPSETVSFSASVNLNMNDYGRIDLDRMHCFIDTRNNDLVEGFDVVRVSREPQIKDDYDTLCFYFRDDGVEPEGLAYDLEIILMWTSELLKICKKERLELVQAFDALTLE